MHRSPHRRSTGRRTSPVTNRSTRRQARSTTTKGASSSGTDAPRRPGRSASPPPSSTRGPSRRLACFGPADLVHLDAAGHRIGYGCGGRRPTWTGTRCRTWCWRWTTARTYAGASSGSTRGADFRRSGYWCRGSRRRACQGSRFMFGAGTDTGRRRRARPFPGGSNAPMNPGTSIGRAGPARQSAMISIWCGSKTSPKRAGTPPFGFPAMRRILARSRAM